MQRSIALAPIGREIVEDRLIEQFVTHAVVERLADPVLHRFSRGNEMLSDPTALSPEVAASDDRECQSYGAKPGTDQYISCRVTKNQQHEAAMAAVLAGSAASGPTTCQSFGNTTSCF
jgi:hypothetical protein